MLEALYTVDCKMSVKGIFPAGIYLLKVNNRNTGKRCEICSKLTIKIPEQRQWPRSDIFIVNFEHVIAGWVGSRFSLFHTIQMSTMKLQRSIKLLRLTSSNTLHSLCMISLKVASDYRSGLLNLLSKTSVRVFFTLYKKMKFSIKDLFSKCDQIRSFLRIWSHLLNKSFIENFFFLCSVCKHAVRKDATTATFLVKP